jgi:hypothetical protein
MAKKSGDSNAIRDEEREIETRAASAGKGPIGGEEEGSGAGGYTMPGCEKDNSISMAQRAADEASSFNSGNEENSGSGTEEMEDYD